SLGAGAAPPQTHPQGEGGAVVEIPGARRRAGRGLYAGADGGSPHRGGQSLGVNDWILVGAGDAVAGARFLHPLSSHREVEVVRQRGGDELFERVVGEQVGPTGVGEGRLAGRRLAAVLGGHRQGGALVVGAHGAGGEEQQQRAAEDSHWASVTGSTPSFGLRAAIFRITAN